MRVLAFDTSNYTTSVASFDGTAVTISRACSMWSRARSDCARAMRCSPM